MALLFTAIRYYAYVRENAKVSEAAAQFNLVVNATYKWMAMQNQDNFCGGINQKACTNPVTMAKVIASGLLNENDIQPPWPGSLGMGMNPNVDNPSYVNVGYFGLPQTACENLIEKFKKRVIVYNGKPQLGCIDEGPKRGWQFWGAF